MIFDELYKNGFTIIKNTLKHSEYYLEALKKDPRCHSKAMWTIRRKCRPIFEKLWNTKDLVCSFDGNSLGDGECIPWHVDQNQNHEKGLICVQGVLALSHSNVTRFLSGSQKYWHSLSHRCTDNLTNTWESYLIEETDPIFKKGLDIIKPILEPGDMLLFDSRIVHSVESYTDRAVCYISMVPRNKIKTTIQRKRKKAYMDGWSTTHWCETVILREQEGPKKYKWDGNNLV
jgi:ectoine hydroxylase-related dioxygenase (phytanoyl-CoA dioxygenase family)